MPRRGGPPERVKRFDCKATVPMVCSECNRPIPAGRDFTALVRWKEEYRDHKNQVFVNFPGRWDAVETTVRLALDPTPRVVVDIDSSNALEERENCTLVTEPTLTIHHPQCGVDSRPMRQAPGSYGMGKRR